MADNTLQEWGYTASPDDRLWALIAHLAAFVAPFFGPLVVYLVKKDGSRFVAYHSTQAMVFQLIAWALGGVTCGLGLLLTLLSILLALKANRGEWEGYPLMDGIGR